MNYKKSIVGSSIAFILATSCCWLPALIIGLGGASLLAFANGLEQFSGIFMAIAAGSLMFGIFQFYEKRKEYIELANVELQSMITCPECRHAKEETMPNNACQFFYECENCKKVLKPNQGDCCVYCSYGTIACPPIQLDQKCC